MFKLLAKSYFTRPQTCTSLKPKTKSQSHWMSMDLNSGNCLLTTCLPLTGQKRKVGISHIFNLTDQSSWKLLQLFSIMVFQHLKPWLSVKTRKLASYKALDVWITWIIFLSLAPTSTCLNLTRTRCLNVRRSSQFMTKLGFSITRNQTNSSWGLSICQQIRPWVWEHLKPLKSLQC